MKNLQRLAIFVTFALGGFCLLGGCYPAEEDFIPEKMGVADDGLWLYRSDLTRTRSDGSGREELPLVAELGEETEVTETLVCSDAHTLFYVSEYGGAQSLFCYDLVSGENKELIPLGREITLTRCERFVFAEANVCYDRVWSKQQLLYGHDAELLFAGEGYAFNRRGEVLYSCGFGEELSFRWWRDSIHSVCLPQASFEPDGDLFFDNGYAYFLYGDGILRTVDLETGALGEGVLPALSGVAAPWEGYSVLRTDGYPVCIFEDGETSAIYTLKNGQCVKVYSVGKSNCLEPIVYNGGAESGRLCFKAVLKNPWGEREEYIEFDRDLNFSVIGKEEHSHASPSATEKFVCGEFSFWAEQVSWRPAIMAGLNYCLYLYRQRGTEEPEIMQYEFSEDDFLYGREQPYYYFFDDIIAE